MQLRIFLLTVKSARTVLGVYLTYVDAQEALLEHSRHNHGAYDGDYDISEHFLEVTGGEEAIDLHRPPGDQ